MVDPDSDRVSRAPPYSGTASWSPAHSAYAPLTRFGRPFQTVPLCADFLKTPRGIPTRPFNPACLRFGLFRVRSPLLAESLLISFPALLRWFTSRSIAPPRCLPLRARCTPLSVRVTPFGYPRISGCLLLPAAFRGLPRPSSPSSSSRHPPQTSFRLTISPFSLPSLLSFNHLVRLLSPHPTYIYGDKGV